MTGGMPFGLGFGFGPMPMPGPIGGDPGQMQLDDEQRRVIAARLLGSQMFHPGNGPAAMDALGDQDQGQDQGPGQYGGQAVPTSTQTAPQQTATAPTFDSPLASMLGGAPSMLGGQMPAPSMPAAPQQDAPNPASAPAPGQIPSLIGSVFPQMSPPGGPQATGAITHGAGPGQQPVTEDDVEAAPVAAPGPSPTPGRAVPTPPARLSNMSAIDGAVPQSTGSFDPLTGQPVSGSPQPARGDFDPLTGQPVSGSPRPATSSPPGGGAPARQGPEPTPGSPEWAKEHPVLDAWRHIGESGIGDQLLAFGAGMLQGRSFGEGAGKGFQNMLAVRQSGAAGDMQRLEYGLKLQKAQQEQAGQNLTAQRLIQLGEDPENVRAAIGASMAGRPEALQNMLNNRFRKTPDAPSGYRQLEGGGLEPIQGGPADLKRLEDEAKAKAKDETQTPLVTPEARLQAGIPADDTRAAWKDPNGKVTFTDGPKETAIIREWQRAKREDGYAGTLQQYKQEQQGPRFIQVKGPNGETVTKRYNPATGQAEDIPGATPPAADNSGIPAGVDPATYRKEAAKAAVAEQKGATQRAQDAANIMPTLERAEKAYRELHENGWIGPVQASRPSRWIGGAAGGRPEILRQEYEAAQKELELAKARVAMKGQGSITDAERRLLSYTFPRLDAASGETGLSTLQAMRSQFAKAMGGGAGGTGGQGRGPAQSQQSGQQQGGQQQPQTNAAASRYQQLRRGGMSQADAYSRMQQEGY